MRLIAPVICHPVHVYSDMEGDSSAGLRSRYHRSECSRFLCSGRTVPVVAPSSQSALISVNVPSGVLDLRISHGPVEGTTMAENVLTVGCG